MTIFNVLTMLGGLALFLYGMNTMSAGLEKMAGGKLESIFEKLTSNQLKSVGLGTVITAVLQSSSATTVMLVGFVNAGLMQLHQAIGVIMGANIGTTVTAWILSLSGIESDNMLVSLLKPQAFSPVFALVGVILTMAAKSDKKKTIGSILIGFAVLMFGMQFMSGAVEPLKDSERFREMLVLFSNPLFGVVAGALLTAVLQSSAAAIGMLQALSSSGMVNFGSALPILLGQNIGTCITAILSAIGTSKNAKRVAAVHLSFNIIGTLLFLTVFYTLNAFIGFTFLNNPVDEKTVALVHTVFNVSTTIVLLPFSKALEKLAFMVIKEGEHETDADEKVGDKLKLLDDRFLRTPSVAVEQSRMVMSSMAKTTMKSVVKAGDLLFNEYDEDAVSEVFALERLVDKYEDGLGTYLVKVSTSEMGYKDSHTVNTLLHSISDLERISDHACHIGKCVKEMHEKEIMLSDQALGELRVMCDAVNKAMEFTITALTDNDLYAAYEVEPLEEVVDQIHTKLKSRHVKRLQAGKCTIELGFIFTDILTALERISDHCSNVAVCMVQVNDDNFETHEYLRTVKTSGAEFDTEVEKFQQQFVLPKKEAAL